MERHAMFQPRFRSRHGKRRFVPVISLILRYLSGRPPVLSSSVSVKTLYGQVRSLSILSGTHVPPHVTRSTIGVLSEPLPLILEKEDRRGGLSTTVSLVESVTVVGCRVGRNLPGRRKDGPGGD